MGEKDEKVEVAIVKADITNIKELLLDIKGELKDLNQTFVPRAEINEMFKNRDEKISENKEQIKTIKENQNSAKAALTSWLSIIIAALALLYSFIK
jgi:hypothetical protein